MRKLFVCLCLLFGVIGVYGQSFEKDQHRHKRVKKAKKEKRDLLKATFQEKGLNYENFTNVYLRAFKTERTLEVWVQGDFGQTYQLLKTYEFCTSSGFLGPKRKRGDLQIPEGFYFISRFNPTSNYHLSLGVNYPNPSDSQLSEHDNLGGDIYIHGACKSIGCISITDDKIKELYLLAVKAKNNGQRNIPIHIFPNKFDFNPISFDGYDNDLVSFWQNIEGGYYYFEIHKRPPLVHIHEDGTYEFF